MRKLPLFVVFALAACGDSSGDSQGQSTPARELLLEPLGTVLAEVYPGQTADLKLLVLDRAGANKGSVARVAGQPVTWHITSGANLATISTTTTASDADGVAQIEVSAEESGLVQVEAATPGTEPVTFTVKINIDARQLELLVPASLATTVAKSELLRFRLTRPPEGGMPGAPVADGIVTASLLGGAQNGARLEGGNGSTLTATSDATGLVSLRFFTGNKADVVYQVELCGQGSCPHVQSKALSITVKDQVSGGGGCQYLTDCTTGDVCEAGTCRPAASYCATLRDCPTGYRCGESTHTCEVSPGTLCSSDNDCESSERCGSAGTCIPEDGCTRASDCTSGWSCDAPSGACLPPANEAALDVSGTWKTRYHFDISKTFNSTVTGALAPIIDFLNLVFAGQLQINIPILGDILEGLIQQVVQEYVPAWFPKVTTVVGDFIHLFENIEANGEMVLVQSPTAPYLGTTISGEEVWTSAQLYVASLCEGGPAAFLADKSCGRLDVVLEPTFTVSYSNNTPTVGVQAQPFSGEIMGNTLVLRGRNVAIALRQLVNVALDVIVAVASDGAYYDFESFLRDAVPCAGLQAAIDDLACNISGGDVCQVSGVEPACEAASSLAVTALTNLLGNVPVSLDLEFDARILAHDEPQNGVADVLGSVTNPDLDNESTLLGYDQALVVFGGELDANSWWVGERM